MNPHYRPQISRSLWATPKSIQREQGSATPAPAAPALDPIAQPHQDANHAQPVTKKARRNERSAWAQTLNENRGQAGSRVQTDEVQGGVMAVNDTAAHEMSANAQLAELVRTDPALEPLFNDLHQYREVARMANLGVEATLKAICQRLDATNQADEQRLNAMRTQVEAPARQQEAPTLVIDYVPQLTKAPYCLATQDIEAIESNDGGKQALQAVNDLLPKLIQAPYCLKTKDIVAIASTEDGNKALQAVFDLLPQLTHAPYCLKTKDILAIASTEGGSKALQAVIDLLPQLIKAPYCLETKDVVDIARQKGGKQALQAVIDLRTYSRGT